MNKYEEALNELSYPLDDSSCGCCKCGESDCSCEKRIAVETLQQLVDRATPKKAILVHDYDGYVYECPICHMEFRPDYIMKTVKWNGCPYCFQTLKWSDE